MIKGPMPTDPGDESAIGVARPSGVAPLGDYENSSSRPCLPGAVPVGWLDRLLLAVLDLPLSAGERAVAEAIVDAVAGSLPGYAVGACLVTDFDGGSSEQISVKRLPQGMAERIAPGVDPTRLFPSLPHEYVAHIPGVAAGSTLHLGSDGPELERDGAPQIHLLERAAMVLGRALPAARATVLAGRQRSGTALEQRMIQADKLATFGQIAAGFVHELNNPLTSIIAYSDYLARKAADGRERDPEDVERLRRISESANRILRFTRELVSYARPSRGAVEPVMLHTAIDQAVAFCEHVLSASNVRVVRAYGAEVQTVRGASEQLVQVFVNLLTNACQAAPATGGRVVVTTSCPPGPVERVVIVVEDDGSGIAPDHLAQVFVPFFTTRGDKHGTGLGLSIVKSIVDAHYGEIRVDSQCGRGTRFVIELPVGSKQE